jgi:hypothetical protein
MKTIKAVLLAASTSLILSQLSYAAASVQARLNNESETEVTGQIQSSDGAVLFNSRLMPHQMLADRTMPRGQPHAYTALFTFRSESPVSCSKTFNSNLEFVTADLSADARSCMILGTEH